MAFLAEALQKQKDVLRRDHVGLLQALPARSLVESLARE
jgi:hypothetical protein